MMHLQHLKRREMAVLISGLMMNTVFTVAMAADATATQNTDTTTAGATATKNTDNTNVTSLNEVTVKSKRNASAVARAQQETAPNLVNVLSSEDISKLPDVNAAEAIRRLPGISMAMGSGEGRFINIRGLDADLTATTFGGVRLVPTNASSVFGGGRAVEMGVIPTGMIGSVTVTKTNKPEQDAEALGGTIEITPKSMPADGKPFLDIHLGYGVEQLRSTPVQDYSISGGIRFGYTGLVPKDGLMSYSDAPFSFVGSASRYTDSRGVNDLEGAYQTDNDPTANPKAYSQLDQRYNQLHRQRWGYGGELAFQPNATDKWYVRYYDSGYHEHNVTQHLTTNFSGNVVTNANGSFTDPNVTFQQKLHNEYETMESQVFTIGGKQALGEANVDYLVGYSKGQDNRPMDQTANFNNPGVASVTYNNVANPSVPAIMSVSGVDPANPNGFTLANLQNLPYLAQTTEWTEQANLELPTHFSAADSEHFKTGVSGRQKKNSLTIYNLNNNSPAGVPLSQVTSGPPITYYDANYNIGPAMDIGAIQNFFNQGMVIDPAATAQAAAQNTENVLAAYVQEDMTFGKLGLLYGLRLESTNATHSGNAVSGSNITPVSTSSSYTNVFPSIQARYELTPDSLLRGSISSTISRPGFNQSSASTQVNVGSNQIVTGNPNLKPTLSTNFDLSIEHYLPLGGIVSAGVFDKALKDYIVNQVQFKNFPSSGIYSGLSANTSVVTYGNIPSATARGLELNYEQHYTFLPGFLSGLGTSFNYTYVDSQIQIRPGEYAALPSTSKNSYNAAVFWERNGLNLMLSANFQGRSLAGIGGNASTDIYSEARTSLDLGASYQVAKNYSLFASAKNLNNEPLMYSEGTSNRLIQREYYGVTYEIGANMNF